MKLRAVAIACLSFSLALVLVASGVLPTSPKAEASISYGHIIDDNIFENQSSSLRTASQTDAWLNGNFTGGCISGSFRTPDPQGWSDTQNKYLFGSDVTSGTALHDAGALYRVNPQVILTTMQKEQSMVSGGAGCYPNEPNPGWPASSTPAPGKTFTCTINGRSQKCTYACTHSGGCENIALGYGCPGYCAAADESFSMQVTLGTWLLRFGEQRAYGNLTGYTGYETGDQNFTYNGPMTKGYRRRVAGGANIYYDGTYTPKDSSTITIANGATASLYNFTPYESGNGHFFTLFSDWFGAPNIDHSGDVPLVGDWDGNGTDTIGVKRGNVYYLDNNNDGRADVIFTYGKASDVPLVGDWDGNGTDTISLKIGNRYFINNGLDSVTDSVFTYGRITDTPLAGDWDGNGTDTISLKIGNRYFINNGLDSVTDSVYSYGRDTDKPLAGDWDGNGTDTISVKIGNRYFINNGLDSTTDFVYAYAREVDTPLVGDWDGNGTDTIGAKIGSNSYYINNAFDSASDYKFDFLD